jgi:hypothetical protein
MDTTKHPRPDVPPMHFNMVREAQKAHGVTLADLTSAVQCRCDGCGAQWSAEGSLEDRLRGGSAMPRRAPSMTGGPPPHGRPRL